MMPEAFGHLWFIQDSEINGEGNNSFAIQLQSVTYLVHFFSVKNIKPIQIYNIY